MQSEITSGTILQNRYQIIRLLGQGGFGRTYLAENERRFNELCALKEFIPPQGDRYALQKAEELFLREAATLYQIEHPQIPKFRETFEQDGRLFLVQDYVEGKTYGSLLQEKLNAGETFSDLEVFHLIDCLLPVLEYIHEQGIIHRDISPDNIICREGDQLPVLIDFGVVKELVNQIQFPGGDRPATTVGKIGYAPSEQIQSGRAYPSSDLYSLAVTAVVLLSGREPQELFDDATLSWKWEQFVQPPLEKDFAYVLNRMLSYRPGQRYQTVHEVAYTFDQLKRYHLPEPIAAQPVREQTSRETQSNFSEMKTVAVSQPQVANPNQSDPIISNPDQHNPLLESPVAIASLLIVVSLFTGLTSWLLVTAFNKSEKPVPQEETAVFTDPETRSPTLQKFPTSTTPTATPTAKPTPNATSSPTPTPTPTPTPKPKPTPTPTPTPTPEAKPKSYNQPVEIRLGVPQVFKGKLKAKETINYTIQGEAGEELLTFVSGQGVLMTLIGPNGQISQKISMWEGVLPATGEYTMQLSPLPDLPGSNYELEIRLNRAIAQTQPTPTPTPIPIPIPIPTPTPTPTPTPPPRETSRPTPRPTPSPNPTEPAPNPKPRQTQDPNPQDRLNTEVVSFPGGAGVQQLSDTTSDRRMKRYLVNVEQGKTLDVEILRGAVSLDIRYPNGQLVEGAEHLVFWQGQVAVSGQYQIDVVAPEAINFGLEIQVRD